MVRYGFEGTSGPESKSSAQPKYAGQPASGRVAGKSGVKRERRGSFQTRAPDGGVRATYPMLLGVTPRGLGRGQENEE